MDSKTEKLEKPEFVSTDADMATSLDKQTELTVGSSEELVVDPQLEKKVLRKVDANLITMFSLLYLMCFLDRANIGNANLTTFSKDLGLKGNQYGAAVSVIYSTCVAAKIVTPRLLLAYSCIGWSVITIGTAFIKNYSQLLCVRVLLGIFEGVVIPCVNVFVTMAYKREEYATRFTYIFMSSAFSGAFGGLLAFGLTQIETTKMRGWQWMYLVEGIISFVLVPLTFIWIPRSVEEAWWLKPQERAVMKARAQANLRVYDDREQYSHGEMLRCLRDWKVWVLAVSHFGLDCTLYALTTFMPKIISGLGFTTEVKSQLLTIPVYTVAAVSYLIIGRISDRIRLRSPFILGCLASCLVGYSILAAESSSLGARYFALCLIAVGLYTGTSLNVVWVACNTAGHFKRALAIGLVIFVGNSSGTCIGFIFNAQSAPRYFRGMYFSVGMVLMSMILTTITAFFLHLGNKKKLKLIAEGAPDVPELGDRNPHLLYFL